MNTQLAELTARLEENQTRLERAERRLERANRRARLTGTLALAALVGTTLIGVRPAVLAQAPGVTLASLQAAITALQQKTAALTQTGTPGQAGARLTVSGVNVQIVDGNPYGLTDDGTGGEHPGSTLTGLGNLVIGYNSVRGGGTDARLGSHNLILGDRNNYSSYAGIVAGYQNTVTVDGAYAGVTGGRESTASGAFSSVTGGYGNMASGRFASVTGGKDNTASGVVGSITGGYDNSASGDYSVVTGGVSNTASGIYAAVAGGQNNEAEGTLSAIAGGSQNTTSTAGYLAVVTGGTGNTATQQFEIEPFDSLQTTVNTLQITASDLQSTVTNISAGLGTLPTSGANLVTRLGAVEAKTAPITISDDPMAGGTNTLLTFSGVNVQIVNGLGSTGNVNGLGNLTVGYNAPGNFSGDVRTGSHNLIVGDYNSYSSYGGIIAGASNSITAAYASVTGGFRNLASGIYSSVSGGFAGTASGLRSSVTGGYSNTASGDYSSVTGGDINTASGFAASISGGDSLSQDNHGGWSAGSYHSP